MLADLPPTPIAGSPQYITAAELQTTPKKPKSPNKVIRGSPQSPRRSPVKNISVGKASGRKAHRVSRRPSSSPAKGVVVSYETEYMLPIPPPSFPSMKSLIPPSSSLLPNSFVLPPPSPRASIPTSSLPPLQPLSPPELQPMKTTTPPSAPAPAESLSPPDMNLVPSTPPAARRPFPVAKPFAQRMIHAYSPAKPSPLSRILMLSDSPLSPNGSPNESTSPSSGPLEVVTEESYEYDAGYGFGYGNELFPSKPAEEPQYQQPQEPEMSLAAELGISESPPDTPLQEKKPLPNVVPEAAPPPRVFYRESSARKKPFTAAEKGKAKASEPVSRPRTSALGEKENSNTKARIKGTSSNKPDKVSGASAAPKPPIVTAKTSIKAVVKASTQSTSGTSRQRLTTKPPIPPAASTGPRRVLVNSADAPPIGKRKG